MQDHPEHLLHAHWLAHRHDPKFNYDRDFEFHISPVYATFFAATVFLSKFLPVQIAGQMVLSLYSIVLVAAQAVRFRRRFLLGTIRDPCGLSFRRPPSRCSRGTPRLPQEYDVRRLSFASAPSGWAHWAACSRASAFRASVKSGLIRNACS